MNPTTIDDLPDEMLIKIFSYLDREIRYKLFTTDVLARLILVCKRWEYLIRSFFKFRTNTFFIKERSEDEKKLVMASNRRFEILHFKPQSDNIFYSEITNFQELREKYEDDIDGIKISIGTLDKNEALADKEFRYRGWHLGALLDMAKNVQELQLRFAVTKIIDYQFQHRNFSNIRILNIYGEKLQDQQFLTRLLDYFRLENLEQLQFEGNFYDSEIIPKKVLIFASKLEKLKSFLIKWPCWSLTWTPKRIDIKRGELVNDIKNFLKGRLDKVKELRISPANFDWQFIAQEAKELERIVTGADFLEFHGRLTLPNVKTLRIETMQVSEANIRKLKDILPNLEGIQLMFPRNFEDTFIWKFRTDAGFIPMFFEVFPNLMFVDPVHKYEYIRRSIDLEKRDYWNDTSFTSLLVKKGGCS